MISIHKRLSVSSVLLIAVLLSIIAYQAGANRIAPSKPTTIATVDLQAVMEGLDQRGEAQMQLRQIASKFDTERKTREAEIQRLRTEHDQLARQARENAALESAVMEIEETLVHELLRYETWVDFNVGQMDLEHALVLEDLYRRIKMAAREMSTSEGYDLVLVNDADAELAINPESRASRRAQIEQQMLSRIMLYANPTIDITADLVERMNNAHRAGAAR